MYTHSYIYTRTHKTQGSLKEPLFLHVEEIFGVLQIVPGSLSDFPVPTSRIYYTVYNRRDHRL